MELQIQSRVHKLFADRRAIDIPHVEVNPTTYRDFQITEHPGSRFTATYPGGKEVELRGDEDLEEVKETIDWILIEQECESDPADSQYYGKHWNEDKI